MSLPRGFWEPYKVTFAGRLDLLQLPKVPDDGLGAGVPGFPHIKNADLIPIHQGIHDVAPQETCPARHQALGATPARGYHGVDAVWGGVGVPTAQLRLSLCFLRISASSSDDGGRCASGG